MIASSGKLRAAEFPLIWFVTRTMCPFLDDTHSQTRRCLSTSCGGRAGKKSDGLHRDGADGLPCSLSLIAGAGEYTGDSNFVFALRNSIMGQFPSATSDLRELIKYENPSSLKMEKPGISAA